MVGLSSNMKTHCHTRSTSLPSTSHQLSSFNDKCHRFHASSQEATTCSSSSSHRLCHKLNRLQDMYESIETMLTLPSTQQSLNQRCQKEQMNVLLDKLLELLELCSTAKEALSQSMDSVKELQSFFRRKRDYNHGAITSSVMEYLSQRRNVQKVVHKALSGLKKRGSLSIKEDQKTTSNINIMKETESNTFVVFQILFTFILGSNQQSATLKRWLYVSKMMGYKSLHSNQIFEQNEVKKVDHELHTIMSHMKTKGCAIDIRIIQKDLEQMESSLADLNEQVECLYRHLIKTRVSLLNILNC